MKASNRGWPVSSRSEKLRRQHRRILCWSLGVAVALHAVVLYVVVLDRPAHVFARDTELVDVGQPGVGGIPIRVFFTAPQISVGPDSLWREPEGRVLSSQIAIPPPPGCTFEDWGTTGTGEGVIRLSVSETGHAEAVAVAETSGSWCWDALLGKVAGSLLYRWLPSERFPAPVDVFQPIAVSLVQQ